MQCAECKSHNIVVVCTFRTVGMIVRRRHCRSCSRRWYTMQMPEIDLPNYAVRWQGRGTKTSIYLQYHEQALDQE